MENLKGRTFRTAEGKEFQVLDGTFYERGSHDKTNGAYLDSLRSEYLVSVAYHGHPTPIVTRSAGVVKLSAVVVSDEVVRGARNISAVLGVSDTRKPVQLEAT